jgi:hypothetical protein
VYRPWSFCISTAPAMPGGTRYSGNLCLTVDETNKGPGNVQAGNPMDVFNRPLEFPHCPWWLCGRLAVGPVTLASPLQRHYPKSFQHRQSDGRQPRSATPVTPLFNPAPPDPRHRSAAPNQSHRGALPTLRSARWPRGLYAPAPFTFTAASATLSLPRLIASRNTL